MSLTHFFSVSVVAVDCWPLISFRVMRMVESMPRPWYRKVPMIAWTCCFSSGGRSGAIDAWVARCCVCCP